MPSREKGAKTCLGSKARHFLLSGLSATSEELRPFPAIFRSTQASFSALQTAWRRERDSNPRYPFGYIGFQDRLFQPLTHPSALIPTGSAREPCLSLSLKAESKAKAAYVSVLGRLIGFLLLLHHEAAIAFPTVLLYGLFCFNKETLLPVSITPMPLTRHND